MQINKVLNNTFNSLIESKLYDNISSFFNYKNINNIVISNILIQKIEDIDKLNILLELELFLNTKIKLLNIEITLQEDQNQILEVLKYYKQLKKLLTTINLNRPNKYPTLKESNKLRELLDINTNGKLLKETFFQHLKVKKIVNSDSQLLLNPFTSLINLHYIYLDTEYYITFQAELNYKGHYYKIDLKDIILYAPKKDKLVKYLLNDTNKLYVVTYLRDISSRIILFKYLLNTEHKPQNIQIYLTNYKKEFMNNIKLNNNQINEKSNENIFTSNEINTGVTNGTQIIITRSEEAMKTLLHEAIHFYNMDFRDIPQYINEWVFGNFNLESYSMGEKNNDILIFEAYTEFMASIFHIISRIYNSKTKSVRMLTPTGKVKMFLQILKEQIIYTFNKCCQILAVSKCQKFDEFKTNNENNTITNNTCKLIEDTNVFCYYYLKLCMYLHIDSILKLCNVETGKFNNEDKSFKKLLSIFKSCYKNIKFKENMNKGIRKYYKLYKSNKHKNKNKINIKTLKTSSYNIKSLKMVIID